MEYSLSQSKFCADVENELDRARAKHPVISSHHQGYGIILEELDEYWDEVKRNAKDVEIIYSELVQIAAMAQRIAEDMKLVDISIRL